MGKVLAIGIDGGTWEVINTLLSKGLLPNIKEAIDKGVSGDLRSSIPPITSPAWKCYSTGKNPGKLGAFWWTKVDFKKKKISFVFSTDFKSKDYWDYIAESGEYVLQINQPMTFPPPKNFNGIFVSGVPAFENDAYTCPKEFKDELIRKYNYRVAPESEFQENPAKFVKEVGTLINNRFDLLVEHIEKADFSQISIFFIDDVQHFTWDQMLDQTGEFKDSIEGIWCLIDSRLGQLRKMIGPDHHLLIFSDHGFTALKGVIHLNSVLKGYISKKEGIPAKQGRTQRFYRLAKATHLTSILRKVIPKNWKMKLQDSVRDETLRRLNFFEWEGTRAFCNGEGLIYINRELIPNEEEYDALRNKIIEDLEALEHPETGENLIEKVYKREDVYKGPYVMDGPDLIALPKLGYEILIVTREDDNYWSSVEDIPSKWKATHRMEGIFVLNGPMVKEGVRIDDVSIYDLAPTILALKGIPIPEDMDGKVLAEAMKEPERFSSLRRQRGGWNKNRNHRVSDKEEELLQKRLESLGYM